MFDLVCFGSLFSFWGDSGSWVVLRGVFEGFGFGMAFEAFWGALGFGV